MMTPFLAFYLTLFGGDGIPARTPEAREQIAQTYGEGTAFVGLDTLVAAAGDTGVAATDWTSSMTAAWYFEEADGAAADDSGADGQDDFTDVGSVVRNTSTFFTGAKSATAIDATDYFSCADATCTGIDAAAGDSFTYGCAVNFTALPTTTSEWLIRKNTSTTGWSLAFSGASTNDPSNCKIDRSAGAGDITTLHDAGGARSTGVWYDIVCTFYDPDGASTGGTAVLTPYENGLVDTTASDTDNYVVTSSVAYINTNAGAANSGVDAYIDECFFDSGAVWDAAEVVRKCSVGIQGTYARCATSDNTLYKPCNSNSDCGGAGGICDTGATAIDDTYCVEGGSSGCCMGYNSVRCGGRAMSACNAAAP